MSRQAGPARDRSVVDSLVADYSLPDRLVAYEPWRWPIDGPQAVPTLSLDDVSGIPFLSDIAGVEEYQHRARLRAGEGDLFAAATPETPGYEAYCRERLKLGRVEFVLADGYHDPFSVAAATSQGRALDRIVARAGAEGGLAIHPYMGIESVWELAKKVAARAGVPVAVLAPPPPITWMANDKGVFSDLVSRILGPEWLVETAAAATPEELARHLLELGRRHDRVALKRLRCASAMGNEVYTASELERLGPAGLEAKVRSFLARTEWDGGEEVQAVAWEETEVSPSTQLWIPPAGDGPPSLQGVYEQILEGERGIFVGSRPSRLPKRVEAALERSSLAVASALQALGYVGRCSFDFLVVGDPEGDFRLRFTECNGRWGGTSTPMSLVDRLLRGPRPPYRAQDFVSPELIEVAFPEILAAVGDDLFDAETKRGRFVFYNVGPLAEFGKLDVISLGRTQDEAEEGMLERLPRLLGL